MSLKDALAGVKQGQAEQEQVASAEATGTPAEVSSSKAIKAKKPKTQRVYGKSSNPEFEKIGVYVRTNTRRKAERKWEDQAGGDLSDLIETLLMKYSAS